MDFISIYKDKKVLLTGHTGFKGTWLLAWFVQLGAIVKGYALPPTDENALYNLVKGDDLCESVIADIRDDERLKKEILDFQPDFVFHLAAQPLVRLSYNIPLDTFAINVQGTANVLNALRFLAKPCVAVMITTDKVYQNIESNYAYKEDDKLGGYDPYSASKAAAEVIIESYRNSFFNPKNYPLHQKSISSARAGNVIGGGDWSADRIVPDIVKALINQQTVYIRNPKAVRPWQHVLDPLHGYLILGAKQAQQPQAHAGAYNFGPYPTECKTVRELAEEAINIWGDGQLIEEKQINQPHEANLLYLDIQKATHTLDWRPHYNAHQAITATISWYKNHVKNPANCLNSLKAAIDNFLSVK